MVGYPVIPAEEWTLQGVATDPEQSRRLLRGGVPAETSDMHWRVLARTAFGDVPERERVAELRAGAGWMDDRHFDRLPAWSIGRLLDVLGPGCLEECVETDILPHGGLRFKELLVRLVLIAADSGDIRMGMNPIRKHDGPN